MSCTKTPSYKITFLDSNKSIEQCDSCFDVFKIMSAGFEEKFTVEVLQ